MGRGEDPIFYKDADDEDWDDESEEGGEGSVGMSHVLSSQTGPRGGTGRETMRDLQKKAGDKEKKMAEDSLFGGNPAQKATLLTDSAGLDNNEIMEQKREELKKRQAEARKKAQEKKAAKARAAQVAVEGGGEEG